jgi:ubiquinone/menaquinone biosynthesis C-methylase UbiE
VVSDFAGSTARHYRRFRRDVPDVVLTQLCEALGLSRADSVLDLGCGTGQVAVPLAARVGSVIAVDPEPDMLAQLEARTKEQGVENVSAVLGADSDLPALLSARATDPIAAVTIATALHWMNAEQVFATSRDRLRADGGLGVITQGLPLWLQDSAWSRALNRYLTNWVGPLRSTCGTDRQTLAERRALMLQVGYRQVETFEYHDQVDIDPDYVIGNLYSAMSQHQIAAADRPRFERDLRAALELHKGVPLVERIEASLLVGRI